jgi:tryptophanyl-tRNA synthetase
VLKKKIMALKTDSAPVEAPKDPDASNIFQLFRLFAPAPEQAERRERFSRGGVGYGELKKRTVELASEYFAAAREKRQELLAHPERVREILAAGAAKARALARPTLERAREACGMW